MRWYDGIIVGWNHDASSFSIEFEDGSVGENIPRININIQIRFDIRAILHIRTLTGLLIFDPAGPSPPFRGPKRPPAPHAAPRHVPGPASSRLRTPVNNLE